MGSVYIGLWFPKFQKKNGKGGFIAAKAYTYSQNTDLYKTINNKSAHGNMVGANDVLVLWGWNPGPFFQ
jgi:hypothetical protein